MSLSYMLLPALLVDINRAFSTVVNMGSGILSTNRTLHWLPPEIAYQPHPFYPPLLERRGGWWFLKGLRPFKLPLINDLSS